MKQRVLICGATGFIGRELVKQALEEGWIVELGVRDTQRAEQMFKAPPVENIRKIDVIDERSINFKNIDIVFNTAVYIPKDDIDVREALLVNAYGTYNLLKTCTKTGVKKFIHSSSMAVFGRPEYIPVDEKHPKRPFSQFGVSELAGEKFCMLEIWNSLQRVILRYSSVYGPHMNERRVTAVFMNKMIDNEPIKVYRDNSGDFVFVEDVARANILAAKKQFSEQFIDFNIGSGKETTTGEVVNIMRKFIKSKSEVEYKKSHRVKRFKFDISKAQRLLDYNPNFSYEKGIAKYYQFKLNK